MDPLADSLIAHAALLAELAGEASQPALRDLGISPAMFDLLSAVHAAGGNATQVELATRLGVRPPTLSESAQAALKAGLLESAADRSDRRIRFLRLTPKGREVLDAALQSFRAVEDATTEGVDREALLTTIEVLRQAARQLARHAAREPLDPSRL